MCLWVTWDNGYRFLPVQCFDYIIFCASQTSMYDVRKSQSRAFASIAGLRDTNDLWYIGAVQSSFRQYNPYIATFVYNKKQIKVHCVQVSCVTINCYSLLFIGFKSYMYFTSLFMYLLSTLGICRPTILPFV